jgi:hypothetical protein
LANLIYQNDFEILIISICIGAWFGFEHISTLLDKIRLSRDKNKTTLQKTKQSPTSQLPPGNQNTNLNLQVTSHGCFMPMIIERGRSLLGMMFMKLSDRHISIRKLCPRFSSMAQGNTKM